MEKTLTAALVVCAVVVTVSVAYGTFSPSRGTVTAQSAELVENWAELVQAGIPVLGEASAPLTAVAFIDLECPACAGFHRRFEAFEATNPGLIRLLHIPFPLGYHEHARGAAAGGLCAAEEGRYGQWVDAVTSSFESLGDVSWGALALEAGIEDTTRVSECAGARLDDPAIESGLALGRGLEINGVPTVVVEGWHLSASPSAESLDSIASALPKQGHLRPPGRLRRLLRR